MADDQKISFLLDLDVKEFTEAGIKAKGIIEQLGSSENVTGLVEGLTKVGMILGTAGIAAYAFKEAIDLTVEGEEINQINEQFKTLSTNAGVVPAKLESGMKKAAQGLVSTTDLLKLTNGAIVQFGENADKLPEVMNLAVKATQVYGGTATEQFNRISNAIATGRTESLKQLGIVIDSTKAQKDFADSIGKTVDQLSEAGKRQAILNAALASGREAYKNIHLDSEEVGNTLEALKSTWKDIVDAFAIGVENTIGPSLRKMLGYVKETSETAKTFFQDVFGKGPDQAEAHIKRLNNELSGMKKQLADLEKIGTNEGMFSKLFKGDPVERAKKLRLEISAVEGEIKGLEMKQSELDRSEEAQANKQRARLKASQNERFVDQQKELQANLAFKKELEKANSDYYKAQEANVNSLAQIEEAIRRQKEVAEKQHLLRLEMIHANAGLKQDQKKRLIDLEEKRNRAARIAYAEQEEMLREKLLNNYLKKSQTVYQGITRAAHISAMKASADLRNFGKMGADTMQSFSMYSTAAFEQMGQAAVQSGNVGQSVADAMKNMFLNVIADRAIATGSMMVLESVWPPNPVELAAGGGLIALGGALRTLGGGSGTTVGGAVGGGVGTSGIGVVTQPAPKDESSGAMGPSQSDMETATPDMSQMAPQRNVTVNIAGNYLETDSSKRMLMDLMRQESDATGFQYNTIGA